MDALRWMKTLGLEVQPGTYDLAKALEEGCGVPGILQMLLPRTTKECTWHLPAY